MISFITNITSYIHYISSHNEIPTLLNIPKKDEKHLHYQSTPHPFILIVHFILPLVMLLPSQHERRWVFAGSKGDVVGRQAQLAVKQLFVLADTDLLTINQVGRNIIELVSKPG